LESISVYTILLLTALNMSTVSVALPLIMGKGISRAARLAQASLVSQTLGWIAIIFSGFWAGHWLDPTLSTASMAFASLANCLMFFALQDWLGKRPGQRLLLLLTVLMPIGYALSFSNYSLRVGYANFLLAGQFLIVARATLWPRVAASLPWRSLISLCYFSVAVATIGRGVLGGFYPELYPSFQAAHPINVVAQLVINVTLILIAVAVLVAWREEAEAQLREHAYTDNLTSLLNRHGWEQSAPPLLDHARRHGTPLAIMVLDLDHFKRINDTQGHEVGDQVLRLFGRVIQENCRSSDLAARVGGEEFALLLPQTDEGAALLFEQRLRSALQRACQRQPQLKVDYSAGLALLQPTDTTLTTFLVRADTSLYQAKHLGRGRLQVAD
jgi:diguanylate cyclase (GGDEF)-like protein